MHISGNFSPNLSPFCLSDNAFHGIGEWYEDAEGMHACVGYEDPHWYLLTVEDHMMHLGF
jgi:hypothetical protein